MGQGNSGSMKMNMGQSTSHMGHMTMTMSTGISLVFAICIFAICLALVILTVMAFWKRHDHLKQHGNHDGEYSQLRHSVPMTLGMVSTMAVGGAIGGIMESHISGAYIIGLIVGLALGFFISLPFKGLGVVDGSVAGVMGGLMGVMLGTMIPQAGLYAVIGLLTAVFVIAWYVTFRQLRISTEQVISTETDESAHGRTNRLMWVSRRSMQTILGLIWFFDGIFQLKPQMFTQAFIKQVILPTGQGQPSWISSLVNWGGHFVVGHIVIWNALFALIQLVLGVAMIFNFKIKQTIIASLIWSAIVWIFGEGAGQLLTGQALLLNGAPGGVLIYGLIGIAIYPKNDGNTHEWRSQGIRFAQFSLAILLTLGFVLHLQPTYLTANGLSQVIAVPWLAKTLSNGGAIISVVLGVIELALAVMVFFKFRLRIAVWISIILFVIYWWVGQSFGQIFQPLATDFNSGLLMILLAICSEPELLNGHSQKRASDSIVAF